MTQLTNDREEIPVIAWLTTMITLIAAFAAWGQYHHWSLTDLSIYQIFPLFGLFAFSLLWSQYMMLSLQKFWQTEPQKLAPYFKVTGFLVLAAIIMHPMLLILQLCRDGFGLPPQSYLQHFVAPGLGWVTILGTISFCIFGIYELWRLLGHVQWLRAIVYAADAAMCMVFYHGLQLGDQLQTGWYPVLWICYGVCLLIAVPYLRWSDFKPHANWPIEKDV